jgi:osmotically-inducible protein OsmY
MQQAGLNVQGLRALEVGGIVVLRGKAVDRATAERAGLLAQGLGYARVANLIQVIEPPDDAAIERTAERKLGCTFHVDSQGGVLRVAGRVQHELQKDVAVSALRNIEGVRTLQTNLQK